MNTADTPSPPAHAAAPWPSQDDGLRQGEHYAGLLLNADGSVQHHLILLPGQAQRIDWNGACLWAQELGGSLPNRRELSLLFANCRAHFGDHWYWSGERDASNLQYAWNQFFGNGTQYDDHTSYLIWARAVRRIRLEKDLSLPSQAPRIAVLPSI